MSYSEYTWETGETITAEKLNNLEGGVQEALANGAGYECIDRWDVLFDNSVTTQEQWGNIQAVLSIDGETRPDKLRITVDGTEYVCEKQDGAYTSAIYGSPGDTGESPSFSEYPFRIMAANGWYFETPTAETYNVKVEEMIQDVVVTEGFIKAAKKAATPLKYIKDGENESIVEGKVSDPLHVASGRYSHAEGNADASGEYSHAEGNNTYSKGWGSHAEGAQSDASGWASHAEGMNTKASGSSSHAQNNGTIAQGQSQTVIGEYNVAQGTDASRAESDYAFIIGNGSYDSRSNAFAIRWDGAIVLANGTVLTVAQLAKIASLA